ncbi:hypothetical protein NKJ10_17825 [Mesorhizobium sp. M0204]
MGTLDRIINGIAYGFGGVLGVGMALTGASLLAMASRAVIQYLAPLF